MTVAEELWFWYYELRSAANAEWLRAKREWRAQGRKGPVPYRKRLVPPGPREGKLWPDIERDIWVSETAASDSH